MTLDLVKSRELAGIVGAQSKECFTNAMAGMMHLVDREHIEGAVYCEGYATSEDVSYLPIEHGWITLADGTVYDPTWALFERGVNNSIYVPTRCFTLDEILALMDRAGGELRPPLTVFHAEDRGAATKQHYAALIKCIKLAGKYEVTA